MRERQKHLQPHRLGHINTQKRNKQVATQTQKLRELETQKHIQTHRFRHITHIHITSTHMYTYTYNIHIHITRQT